MRYVEYPARGPASRIIECFWFLDAEQAAGEPAVERIVPDGCAEIIFQCGDPFRHVALDGSPGPLQPRAFVAGVLSRFWLVQPTGRVETMGMRLRPGGVGALFGGSAASLSDEATPLDALLGRAGSELAEQIMSGSGDRDRVLAAERFLAGTEDRAAKSTAVLAAAVAAVMRSRGRARLADIARSSSWSPRQLQRRFRDQVGVGLKTLSRIARFQELLRRLREGPAARWTDHALAAGFYDQAHLVRDFREFTGQSPSRFVADEGMLSRCFSSPSRLAQLLDA
jgi:AraC-like DNA-binding protein